MRQDKRKDVYRVAYEAANTELNEILGAFEQLHAEKSRLEEFLDALEPEIGLDDEVSRMDLKPLAHHSKGLLVVTHCTALWSTPRI
jgi:hypothetical protein